MLYSLCYADASRVTVQLSYRPQETSASSFTINCCNVRLSGENFRRDYFFRRGALSGLRSTSSCYCQHAVSYSGSSARLLSFRPICQRLLRSSAGRPSFDGHLSNMASSLVRARLKPPPRTLFRPPGSFMTTYDVGAALHVRSLIILRQN